MNKQTILAASIILCAFCCLVPESQAQYCDFEKKLTESERREYRGIYKNKSYGYSVEIPGELIGYDDGNPFYQHGFGIVVGGTPQSYVFVNGEPNSLEFASSGDAASQSLKYLHKHGNSVESSEITESHLGPLNAALLLATYTCPGMTDRYVVSSIFAVSPEGSQLYEVSLYAHESRFKRDKAVLDAIVKSWQYSPQQDDLASSFDKCRTVTTEDIADKRAPTFAAYRVPSPETIESPRLDLQSNPSARMYRTVLRQEISQGPNFAGRYRVAVWGCGTSCAMFAVVNLSTGRVITPEGFSHTSAVYFGTEEQIVFPESQSGMGLFGFRKDSKLLAVLGDLDEDENREGAFYFVLENERLRLIHSTLVEKDCEKLREKP